MATGASSIANGLTLDRLPVEILYMVVEELRTEDVTQLRLVCKLFAEVGMGHLFSDIQLIFKPSSFDRLGQVSQHPVISKKVTSIYYETSILMRFDDFETWKSFIVRPRLLSAMSAVGAAERTVDDIQTLQDTEDNNAYGMTEGQLRAAYSTYKKYFAEQQSICRHEYNTRLLCEALSKFPNLEFFGMVQGDHYLMSTKYLVREFRDALQIPYGEHENDNEPGVAQLLSVLLSAYPVGRRLVELFCDRVHWTLFSQPEEILEKLCLAVQSFRWLHLTILTCVRRNNLPQSTIADSMRESASACTAHLMRGALRRFVSSMPLLTDLCIKFASPGAGFKTLGPCTRLRDVVGTFHWLRLDFAAFTNVSTSDIELQGFCKTHAENLTRLDLADIDLTEGTWPEVFQQLRRNIRLKKAIICGQLGSYDTEDTYQVTPDKRLPASSKDRDKGFRFQVAIEAYLTEGGDAEPIDLKKWVWEAEDDEEEESDEDSD